MNRLTDTLSNRICSIHAPATRPSCNRPMRRRALCLAVSLLLAGAAMPVFAADSSCVDTDGNPVAGSTDQGNEGGDSNTTCSTTASAYGQKNNASGQGSSAFGSFNTVSGFVSFAFGGSNEVAAQNALAIGLGNKVDKVATQGMVIGSYNKVNSTYGMAFGRNNTVGGDTGSAFGYGNQANGEHSSAFGQYNVASGKSASALGSDNVASGEFSSAVGAVAFASADRSSAFGYGAQALNYGSTAIGYSAIADRDYAISVGKTGIEHQIIHLAEATQDTDAVNLRQLNSAIAGAGGFGDFSGLAAAFGGGAGWINGTFTAPTYSIQGSSFDNVAAAFAAVDTQLTALGNGGGGQGPQGPAGPAGPMGPQGPAGAPSNLDAVEQLVDAGDATTLASAEHYADDGDVTTLADANTHADAGDTATLATATSYTDSRSASTLSAAHAYTDSRFADWNDTFSQYQQQVNTRFAQTDRRIERIGAMGSAMTHMAVNAANGTSSNGRIAIGIGTQGGQGALSLGYGQRVGDRGSFSLGASFTRGEISTGAGFGFDL